MDPILLDALILISINVLFWLWSLAIELTWPVDLIWSNYPVLQFVLIYNRTAADGSACSSRHLLALSLLTMWSFRLTHNFYTREGIGHEDWRYSDMRKRFGKHFWYLSLVTVFLGQTVFLFGPCLSMYGVVESREKLSLVDLLGALVTFTGIMLETVGDKQMNSFIQAKRERRGAAAAATKPNADAALPEASINHTIMDTGLWAYSRHPNYLGEILFWWGLYILSISNTQAWRVIGPILITLLFILVSVGLMEERQLKNKGQDYRDYQRRVGSSLLLLPRAINEKIGGWMYKNDWEEKTSGT